MKKVHKYIYIQLIIFHFIGCSSPGGRIYESLDGAWHTVLKSDRIQMAGEKYDFNFHNDSFKVRIRSWTDVDNYQLSDTCIKLNLTEYAAGKYQIDNEEIFFNGMFTDSAYKVITRSCFRVGRYNAKYDFSSFEDSIYFGKYRYKDDKTFDIAPEIILKRGKE